MGVGLFHFAAPMLAEKVSESLYTSTMNTKDSTTTLFVNTRVKVYSHIILRPLQRLCDVFSLYRAQEEMPSLIVVN